MFLSKITFYNLHYQTFIFPILSFIFGIAMQKQLVLKDLTLIVCISSILTVAFFLFLPKQKLNLIFLITILFFFGGLLRINIFIKNHLKIIKLVENSKINIFATIENVTKTQHSIWSENILLNAHAIGTSRKKLGFATNFYITIYSKQNSNLVINDKIIINNLLINKTSHKKSISENQSFEEYLLKEQIIATCFTNRLNYFRLKKNKLSFMETILETKTNLLNKLKAKMNQNAFLLYSSIFLGNKENFIEQLDKEKFSYWGLIHYLARSGLHLVIFILIWSCILSFIPIHFFIKQIILITIASIYAALSWSSVSFHRAFIVFIIFEIGRLLKQQTLFLYILSFTCFLMTLFNPMIIFFLDFQLSFGLTFALSFFNNLSESK